MQKLKNGEKKELRSMYLLPKDLQPRDVIKDRASNEERKDLHDLPGCVRLQRMYGKIQKNIPPFVELFDDLGKFFSLVNYFSYCLLFVNFDNEDVQLGDTKMYHRWMVLSFGDGWKVLKLENMERNFGLITAQNMVDPINMTTIGTQTVEKNTRFFHSKVPRGGTKYDHRIFNEENYRRVGGKVKNVGSETSVFGNDDNLKVRTLLTKDQINDTYLPALCKKYFDSYKQETNEIFQSKLQPIKEDHPIISHLNQELAKAVTNIFSNQPHKSVDLVYPFLENFVDYDSIQYRGSSWEGDTQDSDDFTFEAYRLSVKNKSSTDYDTFKKNIVKECIQLLETHTIGFYGKNFESDEDAYEQFTVKKCILFQTKNKKDEYMLWQGSWHLLSSNYIKHIQDYLNEKIVKPTKFPPYKGDLAKEKASDKEKAYNIDAAKKLGYLCLDTKTVGFEEAGNYNKFEYCDLLSPEGKMCHVKFYGGLGQLGYLFNQGFVSGRALHENSDVLEKVQKLVKKEGDKLVETQGGKKLGQKFLNAIENGKEKKTICFVVIGRNKEIRTQVLMIFHEHGIKLEEFGYKVEIEWAIDETPPPKEESKRKTKAAKNTAPKQNIQNNDVTTTTTGASSSQTAYSQGSAMANSDTYDLDTDPVQQDSSSSSFSNNAMISNQCNAALSQSKNKRIASNAGKTSQPKRKKS